MNNKSISKLQNFYELDLRSFVNFDPVLKTLSEYTRSLQSLFALGGIWICQTLFKRRIPD